MLPQDFRFGLKVRDVITGVTGTATGKCDYISGCSQVLVAPRYKEDGTKVDAEWFDIQRLEVAGNDVITLDNVLTPGPDILPPKR